MFDLPYKRAFGAAALFGASLLTACGGGGGDGGDSTDPAPASTTITGAKVVGPLDPVQSQLTTSVFDPLGSAVTGTPLDTVVQCSDAIVNGSVLDIADTVLAALQASAANPGTADPAALAASMRLMVVNLSQLLQGLAGQVSGCATNTLSLAQLQAALHALDGTPLAPLATQLEPVLAQIIATIGTEPGAAPTPSLATLTALVAQLNTAMQTAMAQIPSTAYEAPIVGGALTTVATALTDLTALMTAATSMNAAAASTALQTLVTHVLTNLLTQVVPLATLESQSGSDAISTQIAAAIMQFKTLLGGSVGASPTSAVFGNSLLSVLAPVLAPIETLLPTITGAIMDALAGGTAAGGSGGALAGTPLAPVVNIVTTVLSTLTGGLGAGTGGTTGGSCVFAGIPLLAILCGSN